MKLSPEAVAAIRARFSPKYGDGSHLKLMQEFGIGMTAFYAIVNRHTWKAG